MGQREVSAGEIIRTVWEAEDRLRAGAPCLATRKLAPRGELTLTRFKLGERFVWAMRVRRWKADGRGWMKASEDVFDFLDGDAAWRAAIGWDGKGEPEGFARRRRA